MAEDKTFRYGLIVLGFFLVMVGMFIMSVDKPQVYITFCAMGVFLVAVGVTWSICQCYPKITFVPVESDSSSENGIPEKGWSQTHYTSAEEAKVYESSLPSYAQIHMKVAGSGEGPGDQSAPLLLQSQFLPGQNQPSVQAKAEVHRDSESDEEQRGNPAPTTASLTSSQPKIPAGAPLASFLEDTNSSSSEESPSVTGSPSSVAHRALKNESVQMAGVCRQTSGPPSYDDIALIDAPPSGGLWSSKGQAGIPTKSHLSAVDVAIQQAGSDSTPGSGGSGFLEHDKTHNAEAEEDNFYYGFKEDPEHFLLAGESDFEQ
ncbi:barttin [Microcaecilia unicolor]|uniref:Barttin n=1 Tax=Microcaecilia unicolor TaxID=1415580 RepID=A0A6P7Y6T8_9AMPH|nr:barttin [Microcaecilia unicolor]